MIRLRSALLFLPFLTTLSLAIREKIAVPTFRATSQNGTITFPKSPKLPPVLRNLTLTKCAHAESILIANTPYLPISGTAIFATPKRLLISFFIPHIRIRLKATNNARRNVIKLSGTAIHKFRRPFAMRIHRSRRAAPTAVTALQRALNSNPNGPRLVTTVDHAAAAASVGLALPHSSVVVFGNPAIGSQLWTRRPPVGIELPLEILIASSPLGVVYVAWNTASLLRIRFRLAGPRVDDVLSTIDTALANLAGIAADRNFSAPGKNFDRSRITTRRSTKVKIGKGDAIRAFAALTAALEAAPPVNIAYQIPHEVSAINAGLPTRGLINRVVVFGNPALGTGIMQRAFTAALDLPVKMAVWTARKRASKYRVGYTAPLWIGRRHNVQVPEMLSAALENFAMVALEA